jgi:integrase
MKRRANGHSSLFKGYDGRWHGWVTMNLGAGAADRDRRHVSGKTREIVLAKVSDLERERAERDAPPRPGEPIETVNDWIGYWLTYIAGRRTKAQTCQRYRVLLERNVLPRIGRIELTELHEHHLDRLFGSMLGEGATLATLREVRRVMSTVLNDAVGRELVVRNVTLRAAIPRYTSPEAQPLTVDEAQRVFEVAETDSNGVAWLVALALGLRRTEVLGLRWDDIDFDTGTLSVRRTLQWTPWTHGCGDPVTCCFESHSARCTPDCAGHAVICPTRQGGLAFGAPKSQAAYRTLVMPPSLAAAMARHRDTQPKLRRDPGLVFRDVRGRPINPAEHSKQWRSVLKRADVRHVRLHDARHSAATFLLMQGVDRRTTMALMGWAHADMADRYQHVVTPLRKEAAAQVEQLLFADDVRARGDHEAANGRP